MLNFVITIILNWKLNLLTLVESRGGRPNSFGGDRVPGLAKFVELLGFLS
jgi:hypothetical protein